MTYRDDGETVGISVSSSSSYVPSEHPENESNGSSSHAKDEVRDHVPSEEAETGLSHDLLTEGRNSQLESFS